MSEPVASHTIGVGKPSLHMTNNFFSSVCRRKLLNFSVGASGTDVPGSNITMRPATLGNVDRDKCRWSRLIDSMHPRPD
ncbi:hypothetical protein FOPG_19547 [Fusarium oxysporum f. sp. conglutinans race 2 54008]|uniref:Uncharacterized protein n=1 Tax=Fusarium oxysporum f. sp. conglutinans race 2 54008 TaxID=1089457 RepID=X0GLK3_FUSOX|nr:hypothetical protein FOPG_19547 [Fusarium oxysporum f. sp. conglutinans race 2 54008]